VITAETMSSSSMHSSALVILRSTEAQTPLPMGICIKEGYSVDVVLFFVVSIPPLAAEASKLRRETGEAPIYHEGNDSFRPPNLALHSRRRERLKRTIWVPVILDHICHRSWDSATDEDG